MSYRWFITGKDADKGLKALKKAGFQVSGSASSNSIYGHREDILEALDDVEYIQLKPLHDKFEPITYKVLGKQSDRTLLHQQMIEQKCSFKAVGGLTKPMLVTVNNTVSNQKFLAFADDLGLTTVKQWSGFGYFG